jgi:hypothetical protein
MKEKQINYGEVRNVTVDKADKDIILCVDKSINEGFILMFHGLETLPAAGDDGIIVFEKDSRNGHWQYYPKNIKHATT